jgi:hypothetical protein
MKRNSKQQGSILLVVMFVLSLLATVAISGASTQEAVVEDARSQRDNTLNQMMAESVVDYAARRLMTDAEYAGTGQTPLMLAGREVSITATPTPGSPDGNPFSVVAEAFDGEGMARMQADLTVQAGVDADAEMAMIFLGNEFHVEDSTIFGDTLIADAPEVVQYWLGDGQGGGSWVTAPPDPETYNFIQSTILGDLFKYNPADYGVATEEHTINVPIYAPKWDLDQYLVPGPDRVIYWYENNLKNVSHPETAVFVMHDGHTLSLDGCDFPGGVVVYVDKDWDVRDEQRRNKVLLKHGTTVGGGTNGVHPHIGMIAPGTEVHFTHPGCVYKEDHNDVEGFILWNAVHMIKEARLKGQIIVYREVKHFRETEVVYDPDVVANMPPGIEFGLPYGSASVDQVREYYEP